MLLTSGSSGMWPQGLVGTQSLQGSGFLQSLSHLGSCSRPFAWKSSGSKISTVFWLKEVKNKLPKRMPKGLYSKCLMWFPPSMKWAVLGPSNLPSELWCSGQNELTSLPSPPHPQHVMHAQPPLWIVISWFACKLGARHRRSALNWNCLLWTTSQKGQQKLHEQWLTEWSWSLVSLWQSWYPPDTSPWMPACMLANGHHGLEMNKIWQCSVVGALLLSWVKEAAEYVDRHVCASQRATKANGQGMGLGICLTCSSLSHLTHSSTGSCVLNTSWRRVCKVPLKSALVLMPNASKSVCLGCQPFWCGSGAEHNTTTAPAKHCILIDKVAVILGFGSTPLLPHCPNKSNLQRKLDSLLRFLWKAKQTAITLACKIQEG